MCIASGHPRFDGRQVPIAGEVISRRPKGAASRAHYKAPVFFQSKSSNSSLLAATARPQGLLSQARTMA